MTKGSEFDAWSVGQSYEHYMGRWSRMIASEFLNWLEPPQNADWLEIGCGTGALTDTVLTKCAPKSIKATDQSPDFVAHAQSSIPDPRVEFSAADALSLLVGDASIDVVTSALVLNFIPDRVAALGEMQRILRPDGMLSFYVWDYPGGGIGFIDAFWKAAARVDNAAASLDEGDRFPFCTLEGLSELCKSANLVDPTIEAVEVVTEFADFDAFWHPFTLGAGPAPGYCKSLSETQREQLKKELEQTLGIDGPIRMPARAWAVKTRTT